MGQDYGPIFSYIHSFLLIQAAMPIK